MNKNVKLTIDSVSKVFEKEWVVMEVIIIISLNTTKINKFLSIGFGATSLFDLLLGGGQGTRRQNQRNNGKPKGESQVIPLKFVKDNSNVFFDVFFFLEFLESL